MPVQIHLNGQRYFADDGTDPAELQQYAQMHQQEQAQLNPINQGMQNVFSGINRQIQNYNELPAPTAVPGNTYGMSTQAFNQTAGIIQQDNMNSATARMQQRVQMEQAMEQEKDRAQQIKVQDMQFKNQQKLEKMRQDQEEARLKREAEMGTMTNISGVGPVQMKNIGGVGTATAIPITGAPQIAPKIMPQQFVKTMDAQGNPIMRIATPEELQTGVPLYESPAGGSGFTLSPGQSRYDAQGNPLATLPPSEPQQFVKTMDAQGNPIMRIATPEELQTGVPLYESPAGGSGFTLSPGQSRYDAQGNPLATLPPSEQSKPLTPVQLLDVRKKVNDIVRLENGAWIDNDRISDNYGQVKPEFVNAFNAEVERQLQAATGGAPSAAPAPAQGGGVPANPPMAREGFVNGKPALINDATGEYVLMDEEPIAPTNPPAVDVAVPPTIPQQAPALPPQQPLFDPFANPGILFRTPTLPAGSVTIPYQNQQRSYGTIQSR